MARRETGPNAYQHPTEVGTYEKDSQTCYRARCRYCSWVSRDHDTEDAAEEDASEHSSRMVGIRW